MIVRLVNVMTIGEKIQTDIVTAMKARDEHKLTTLRMVKSALKNKEIDKREKLTDAEETQIPDDADQAAQGVGGVVHQGQPSGAGGEGARGDRLDRSLSAAGCGRG